MVRDLIALDNRSKVWIYQADRDITYDELDEIRPEIYQFLGEWTSHNQDLMTYGNIFHRRFLAIFVDESFSGASGCSIDKSVKFVEYLGIKYTINFFDRNTFAYMENDEIFFIKQELLKQAAKEKIIDNKTLFFDHLVQTKGDFLKRWIAPLENTWVKRFI